MLGELCAAARIMHKPIKRPCTNLANRVEGSHDRSESINHLTPQLE